MPSSKTEQFEVRKRFHDGPKESHCDDNAHAAWSDCHDGFAVRATQIAPNTGARKRVIALRYAKALQFGRH